MKKAGSWQNKSKSFQKTLVSSKDCRFYSLEKGTSYYISKIDVLQERECVTQMLFNILEEEMQRWKNSVNSKILSVLYKNL